MITPTPISNLKRKSGGQALVMVSLCLIAMSGMMGLAVDLGWSYYVQRNAQAAADGAALAAVQKAYKSMQSAGVVTAWAGCPNNSVQCQTNMTPCGSLGNNLLDGCDYATSNGFTDGAMGGKQSVQMQANQESVKPPWVKSATGPWDYTTRPFSPPTDIIYWVTARVSQNIPQLFSAIMGNTQGTVAAIATAAVASKVIPGSFWGMNKRGDCMISGGTASAGFNFTACGRNIDLTTGGAGGGTACPGGGGATAYLCAPAGIVLSSTCANNAQSGCGTNTGTAVGNNYAGQSGVVWGGPGIGIAAPNAADGLTTTSPKVQSGGAPLDPYQGRAQPPIAAASSGSSAIPACGYPAGVIPNTTSHLGPMQYYSYTTVGGVKVPDAQPIQLPNNATFDATATGAAGCPGGVYTGNANSQSSNTEFKSFIFYGGINANGAGTVTFGAGQYILAGNNGNNSVPGASGGSDNVLAVKGTTLTGASGVGEMFILTDGKYPGLSTQMAGVPNWNYNSGGTVSKIDPAETTGGENYLVQGSVQTKNSDMTLNGFDKDSLSSTIPALKDYSGILVWQDRRNSSVIYDANGNVTKCWVGCASTPTSADYTANNVTASSPGLSMSDGSGSLTLSGAIYQGRGTWFTLNPGVSGVRNSPLQLFTGMITGGGGATNVTLKTPINSVIGYVTSLIQ